MLGLSNIPSIISLPVKSRKALSCSNNLRFSHPCIGKNVHRGQPRDKVGDMECERGKKRMSGGKVEEEIRGKINVTRTRELY